ncbi:hypothetical protein A3709_20200 [Halioglobus sp. HI00S01]|nr:hypothetical protein A3709_20200 [Halioglobus sp. HI00S01]
MQIIGNANWNRTNVANRCRGSFGLAFSRMPNVKNFGAIDAPALECRGYSDIQAKGEAIPV